MTNTTNTAYTLKDIEIGMEGVGDITVKSDTIINLIKEDLRSQGYRHWGFTLNQIANQEFEITAVEGGYKMRYSVGTCFSGMLITEPYDHSTWQKMPKPVALADTWLAVAEDDYTSASPQINLRYHLDVVGYTDDDEYVFNNTPLDKATDALAVAFTNGFIDSIKVDVETHTDTGIEQETLPVKIEITRHSQHQMNIQLSVDVTDHYHLNVDWNSVVGRIEDWVDSEDHQVDVIEDWYSDWILTYSVSAPYNYYNFSDFIDDCADKGFMPFQVKYGWIADGEYDGKTYDLDEMNVETMTTFWNEGVFLDAQGGFHHGDAATDIIKQQHANTVLAKVQSSEYDGDDDWFIWQLRADSRQIA